MKPVLQTSLLCLLLGAALLGGCANDVANVQTFVTGSIEREHWVSASALLEKRAAARRARGETADEEPALAYNAGSEPGGYAPANAYTETASTALPPIVLADGELEPMPDPVEGAPLPPVAVAQAEQQTPAAQIPSPAARRTPKKPPSSAAANPAASPSPMVMPVAAVSPADDKPSIRDECLQRVANYYGKDGAAAKKAKDGKAGKEKLEMDTLCALVLKRTAEPGDDTPGWVTPPQAAERPVAKETDTPSSSGDDTKAAGEEPESLSIRDQCLQRLVNVYGKDDRDSKIDANEKIEMDALCAKVLKRTSDSNSTDKGSLGPGWKSLRDASAEKPQPAAEPKNFAQRWAAAR